MKKAIIVDVDGTIVGEGGFLNWGVVRRIRELWEKERVPIVVVTGRPESEREETRRAVRALGIPVREIVMREEGDERPPEEYKTSEVERRGYEPVSVVDDDPEVLAAFGKEWPDVQLHRVNAGKMSEVGILECLLGRLKRLLLAS